MPVAYSICTVEPSLFQRYHIDLFQALFLLTKIYSSYLKEKEAALLLKKGV